MWRLTLFWTLKGTLWARRWKFRRLRIRFPVRPGVTPSTALIGPIVSIQTDTAGNPTQLNLWVHDAEPDDTCTIPNDSIFQVDLTDDPTYQASIMGPNFANLSFGPAEFGRGSGAGGPWSLHKTSRTTPGYSPLPFTVEPTAIYLRLQSMQGTTEFDAADRLGRCHRRLHPCSLLHAA